MSKVILDLAMSLDGYIAGANDEIDWLTDFDPSEYGFPEFIKTVGAIIMGKRSYDMEVQQGWFKDNAYGPSPIFVISEEIPAVISEDAEFHFVSNIHDAYDQAQNVNCVQLAELLQITQQGACHMWIMTQEEPIEICIERYLRIFLRAYTVNL